MFDQRLFGLQLRCERPLPYAPAAPTRDPDAVIRIGSIDRGAFVPWPPSGDAQFHAVSRSPDGAWCLAYHDETVILVEERSVSLDWPSSLTFEDACTYLAGAPFALLLRMRGVTCFHGSAVTLGDRTTAFIGPSGAGKSTIAAALVDAGAGLVTDDLLAIVMREGRPFVLPSWGGIRLWPDAVDILRGDADALPRITAGWEKRILESEVAQEARPLDRVCILTRDDVSLGAADALMALVANSYRPDLMLPAWRRTEFEVAASVARSATIESLQARAPIESIKTRMESAGV